MTASTWLIRVKLGGSHHRTILDGDEDLPTGLAHPPRSRCFFSGIGRPTVGVASGKDRLYEPPDRGPIRVDDIADLHLSILTGASDPALIETEYNKALMAQLDLLTEIGGARKRLPVELAEPSS
jgi:hypothetical protein